MHGDDWKTGGTAANPTKVIDTLKEWNGELVEVEYTKGISSKKLTTV